MQLPVGECASQWGSGSRPLEILNIVAKAGQRHASLVFCCMMHHLSTSPLLLARQRSESGHESGVETTDQDGSRGSPRSLASIDGSLGVFGYNVNVIARRCQQLGVCRFYWVLVDEPDISENGDSICPHAGGAAHARGCSRTEELECEVHAIPGPVLWLLVIGCPGREKRPMLCHVT